MFSTRKRHRNRRATGRTVVAVSSCVAIAISGCGGGGGGGGSTAGQSGNPGAPGPVPYDSSQSGEYNLNYGLRSISAASAYAGGRTGAGVSVALVDTGIDVNNSEYAGAINAASTNIVTGTNDIQDPHGHGTAVAGVVRAARNGIGTHGVAYDASLLVVRSDTPGSCVTTCSFSQTALANATNYAAARGAKVINYSLGGGTVSAGFASALNNAAATAVLVAAAGNTGGGDPLDPALSLALSGKGIAVGSVDANLTIAASSNRAGIAQSYYLVAPGVAVPTTALGGGVSSWSGTSLAVPHVSGAAAILIQTFPSLTPAQVVDLLLRTATDLGAPGVDAVYGRGLVNLQAALTPQGTLSVPTGGTVAAGGSALMATFARLGPAFGDALAAMPLLRQAIVLDSYGRPYGVDLSTQLRRTAGDLDFAGWMRGRSGYRTFSAEFDSGASLSLGLAQERPVPAGVDEHPERDAARPFSFAASLPGGYGIGASRGLGLDSGLGFSGAGGSDISGLVAGGAFRSPFLGMADSGESVAFRAPLGPLTLRFGTATADGTSADGHRRTAAVQVGEVGHTWSNGASIKLQFGDMREQDAVLRSGGSGAYALGDGARTQFVGWFGSVPLSDSVEIAGSYVAGLTGANGLANGVLRDMSALRSESFSVGLFNKGALRDNDRLGFIVSQPLRIAQGSVQVDVPVARTLDGAIVHASRRADLAPSGREIDAELEYKIPFSADESLILNLLMQLEPGHVQDAPPAWFGGLRYRLKL